MLNSACCACLRASRHSRNCPQWSHRCWRCACRRTHFYVAICHSHLFVNFCIRSFCIYTSPLLRRRRWRCSGGCSSKEGAPAPRALWPTGQSTCCFGSRKGGGRLHTSSCTGPKPRSAMSPRFWGSAPSVLEEAAVHVRCGGGLSLHGPHVTSFEWLVSSFRRQKENTPRCPSCRLGRCLSTQCRVHRPLLFMFPAFSLEADVRLASGNQLVVLLFTTLCVMRRRLFSRTHEFCHSSHRVRGSGVRTSISTCNLSRVFRGSTCKLCGFLWVPVELDMILVHARFFFTSLRVTVPFSTLSVQSTVPCRRSILEFPFLLWSRW